MSDTEPTCKVDRLTLQTPLPHTPYFGFTYDIISGENVEAEGSTTERGSALIDLHANAGNLTAKSPRLVAMCLSRAIKTQCSMRITMVVKK